MLGKRITILFQISRAFIGSDPDIFAAVQEIRLLCLLSLFLIQCLNMAMIIRQVIYREPDIVHIDNISCVWLANELTLVGT